MRYTWLRIISISLMCYALWITEASPGLYLGPYFSSSSGLVIRDTAPQDVCNTSTPTVVATMSVPGGSLSTNRMLRFTILGDMFNNSGVSRTSPIIDVTYGGAQVFQAFTVSLGVSAVRENWKIDGSIVALNATNAQASVGRYFLSQALQGGLATGFLTENPAGNDVLAIDSSVAQNFVVTFTNSVIHASLCAKKLAVILELI
jgi:hypothetical protein